MRLNWSNIGEGVAAVAGAVKEKRLRDDLAQVADAGVVETSEAGAPASPNEYAPTEIAAPAQGVTRYKLFDTESDKPLTPEQIDDIRTSKLADVYARHGLTDKSMALRDKLRETQRQRTKDAQAAEEFGWKKKDRASAEATAARDAAVKSGIAGAFKDQRTAAEASDNAAAYQSDLAGAMNGRSLEATIRANAGPGATQDEIDAAVAAYRQSIGEATAQHNAAGMGNLYKKMAGIYGEIGQDPEKAGKFLQMAEAEGVPKLIEAAKGGNVDAMNKLWNTTGQARGIVKSIGQDKKTGDLMAVVIDPYSGKPIGANGFVNITAMERAMMSAADIAKLRETESKIGENEAQAASAYASADSSRASASKARAETEQVGEETRILRATGEKPTAGGGKGYKVEASEVSAALGTPVLNGKPLYSRNVNEENAFYGWMKTNGIKDTNEGLARWLSGDRAGVMRVSAPPPPSKPFDPKAFMR